MPIKFSLSYSKSRVFPVCVKDSAGKAFDINADFRNILKILRLNGDDDVIEQQRHLMTLQWFYKELYPDDVIEALQMVYDFILNADISADDERKRPPQFDYEFDAEEIYASFLSDFNIDLHEIKFLHWYKFKLLFCNLSKDSAFGQKISLRFMDLKGYKGEAYSKLSRAKRNVQLPVKYSREEAVMLKEMINKLRQ